MDFRTASGASYEGRDASGHERFSVSIPLDEHGYLGRECPACQQLFRMHGADYDALPEELELICPYCGHQEPHSEFLTKQQQERVMRVALDAGTQMVADALDKAFGSVARSTSSNRFLRVTYRSEPFYPLPLPGIDEERLIRERQCSECGVRYAVFGEHRFCPVSGALPAPEVASDALSAEQAKLDLLNTLPSHQHASLREQGVLDRIAVDTLSRVVGIVEPLASAEFHRRVPNAAEFLKGRGNVFQRLDDLATLFAEHLGVDVSTAPGVDWSALGRVWAARHAHVHADGMADDKYLRAVPGSVLRRGQRVRFTTQDALVAIRLVRAPCEAIAAG